MKALDSLLPGLLRLSEKLDLRQNRKLEVVDIFEAQLPDWFVLPQHHSIHSITVALGDRSISTQEIDQLINNIHKNTIKQDIYNGMIALTGSQTPSANAVSKISALENNYGWRIELNL